MPEDLKAAALTAPELRDRMTADDWQRVERHAAPRSIEARLKTARKARDAAQRTVDRWEALLALRLSQVEAGTWPPPVERVAWRELKAGDILADDPRGDVLVERAETEWNQHNGEQARVWYQVPGWGLLSRSAPANQKITIRPRVDAGEGAGDA